MTDEAVSPSAEPAQLPVVEPVTEPVVEAHIEPTSAPLEPIPEVVASPPETTLSSPPSPTPALAPPPPVTSAVPNAARDLLVKARAVFQSGKQKKLEKIMGVIAEKGSITNNGVEKLLKCSDATATRYLSQLEKEGRIKKVGKPGPGLMYVKT